MVRVEFSRDDLDREYPWDDLQLPAEIAVDGAAERWGECVLTVGRGIYAVVYSRRFSSTVGVYARARIEVGLDALRPIAARAARALWEEYVDSVYIYYYDGWEASIRGWRRSDEVTLSCEGGGSVVLRTVAPERVVQAMEGLLASKREAIERAREELERLLSELQPGPGGPLELELRARAEGMTRRLGELQSGG